MSNENAVVAATSIKDLLERDGYKKRFAEILGQRAPQFMASIVQTAQSPQLMKCEPQSIIAAAITAAALNLPIDKNLGFSYIVPYGKAAQFQLGYRGFIQLALRSGQFSSMRDAKINKEAFIGYDDTTGDPKIDWAKLDEEKETIGYAFAWRLTNGFAKIVYWSKEQVLAHAKRFSKAYTSGYDSPWKSDFDAMALKTVIKSALSKWAPLSLEMQKAIIHDQAFQSDIDAELKYADKVEPEKKAPGGLADALDPEPPKDAKATLVDEKKLEPKKEKVPAKTVDQQASAQNDDANKVSGPQPGEQSPFDRNAIIAEIEGLMLKYEVSEKKVFEYAKKLEGAIPDDCDDLWAAPTATLAKLRSAISGLAVKKGFSS